MVGTEADNLAYACSFCNRHKGSDLGSFSGGHPDLVRFFNPRRDRWSEHFKLEGAVIKPLTKIGEVTVRILNFNDTECILNRETLSRAGLYPPASALTLITGL